MRWEQRNHRHDIISASQLGDMSKLLLTAVALTIIIALYRTNKALEVENKSLQVNSKTLQGTNETLQAENDRLFQLAHPELRCDTLFLSEDGLPIGGCPDASIIVQYKYR
jgi:hypothetical protein